MVVVVVTVVMVVVLLLLFEDDDGGAVVIGDHDVVLVMMMMALLLLLCVRTFTTARSLVCCVCCVLCVYMRVRMHACKCVSFVYFLDVASVPRCAVDATALKMVVVRTSAHHTIAHLYSIATLHLHVTDCMHARSHSPPQKCR